jgi:hypothetical protein
VPEEPQEQRVLEPLSTQDVVPSSLPPPWLLWSTPLAVVACQLPLRLVVPCLAACQLPAPCPLLVVPLLMLANRKMLVPLLMLANRKMMPMNLHL